MRCVPLCLLAALAPALCAQEAPSFVTYTHQMEEQGNLEIETLSAAGSPAHGDPFGASAVEFEYGTRAWWTTEFYLDGQATGDESALFTGFRLENRFHLVPGEHWINPVVYTEFEDINEADKTILEVVGHDSKDDLLVPNSVARLGKQREIETKLILGSYAKGWTIAENFIAEKNVAHGEPYEFGYALLLSRPLALKARPGRCALCPENFQAGVEMYGGLGTTDGFGLSATSHYIAPLVAWSPPDGPVFKLSTAFGVTDSSLPFLLRLGVSYEIQQIGRYFRRGAR